MVPGPENCIAVARIRAIPSRQRQRHLISFHRSLCRVAHVFMPLAAKTYRIVR